MPSLFSVLQSKGCDLAAVHCQKKQAHTYHKRPHLYKRSETHPFTSTNTSVSMSLFFGKLITLHYGIAASAAFRNLLEKSLRWGDALKCFQGRRLTKLWNQVNKTMTVFQMWPSEPLKRTICSALYISTMEGEAVQRRVSLKYVLFMPVGREE